MLRPGLQFTRTADGVSIAYCVSGQGLPLVFLSSWVSHLEIDVSGEPVVRFLDALAAHGRRRLVRFDWRGTGLSDRGVSDVSVARRVADLEAVVDALGAERVAIFAWALGGPPAILFAAAHPERVSHLVLYGTFASGAVANPALARALVDLIRADWNVGAQTMVHVVAPGGDSAALESGAEFLRTAASGEVAAAILEEGYFKTDVRDQVARVTAPTLVLHRRDDPALPFTAGRELAALLPNARFVPLAGNIANPWLGDSAAVLKAVDEFLGDGAERALGAPADAGSGLLTILFTDVVGSTALTQRLGDEKAQDLLRTHNTIIRDRLREHGGTELKTMGDGFMASFPSATRALECAIAIQQAFAAFNDGAVGDRDAIRVRIGLNAGEPVAEEDDLFGTAVQAAARIAAKARPGQILVSDVVRQLAAGKAFRFNRLGHVQLRGFQERVRLYELECRPRV
jgi:class 3 adenylate cyclase/pimeloyl-ACP methyl ester carboxylesterase